MLTAFPLSDPPEPTTGDQSHWSLAGPTDLAPVRASIGALTAAGHRVTPIAGVAAPPDDGDTASLPVLASVDERLAIVFSELATNALRHGAAPVEATVRRSRDGWVVIVEDAAGDFAPSLRPPGGDGGHGLRLIAWLARAVGWCALGARKAVWAEVAHEPPWDLMQQLQGIVTTRPPAREPASRSR